MKYIDADRLRAGINQNLSEAEFFEHNDEPTIAAHFRGQVLAYSTVLEGLDSLQQDQPEVDLEQTIHEKVVKLRLAPCYDELRDFALYFYELGRKAKEDK